MQLVHLRQAIVRCRHIVSVCCPALSFTEVESVAEKLLFFFDSRRPCSSLALRLRVQRLG